MKQPWNGFGKLDPYGKLANLILLFVHTKCSTKMIKHIPTSPCQVNTRREHPTPQLSSAGAAECAQCTQQGQEEFPEELLTEQGFLGGRISQVQSPNPGQPLDDSRAVFAQ